MPNEKGEGFVDYVLWGDDDKPLALVEAKRTRKSPYEGQQQAKLYADCLEKGYAQRPVIFYREGIKYDDLSEEEKDQWDALEWDEEGNVPAQVEPEAVNKWLFNIDTVDKVLEHLMTRGLKVARGDWSAGPMTELQRLEKQAVDCRL